jgi:hypothetical protein
VARVEAVLDANEAGKRRGRGELIAFIDLEDSAGRHWRTHEAFDLARIPKDAKAQQIQFGQDIFVLPGDYTLTVAICDSVTLEHSLTTRVMHVAPLRTDPLPRAWEGLPAVEFVRNFDTPDNWFQPYVRGRVNIELESRRPIHVDLVMNMTPSDRAAGSIRVFRRNMSLLLPALKVLAGATVPKGSMDVTLMDLAKRVIWSQAGAHGLDWRKMREPFANTNPGVIDLQSLASKGEMLQFFRDKVVEKLETVDEPRVPRVVIVLSAPVFLEHQYKQSVASAATPRDPDSRVYYLRYRPLPTRAIMALDGAINPIANSMPADDLEHVVRSLDGRLFSVISPEEFRKAVATILSDVSRL